MIHGGFSAVERDLSVCLNPLGAPPEVQAWWQQPSTVWMRYPEAHADRARAALAPHLGVSADALLLGNGCGELFALALRALNIAEAVAIRPCYGGYAESTTLAGATWRTLDLPVELWGAYVLDAAALAQAMRQCVAVLGPDFRGALFLANPNNPDGRLLPWTVVEEIAAMIPHGFVFLDQSYMDFLELPSENLGLRAPAQSLPPNVLIFHSFTKFFCLAGVRLAGVYGPARALARLRNLQLPWTVNGPAQEIAKMLYTDTIWLKSARAVWKNALIAIQHEWTAKGVQACKRQVPWLFGRLPVHQSGDVFLQDCITCGSAVRVFNGGPLGIADFVRIGLPVEPYAR